MIVTILLTCDSRPSLIKHGAAARSCTAIATFCCHHGFALSAPCSPDFVPWPTSPNTFKDLTKPRFQHESSTSTDSLCKLHLQGACRRLCGAEVRPETRRWPSSCHLSSLDWDLRFAAWCMVAMIKDAQCTELFCGVAAIAKGFRNSSALPGFVCELAIHSTPKVLEITRRRMVEIT